MRPHWSPFSFLSLMSLHWSLSLMSPKLFSISLWVSWVLNWSHESPVVSLSLNSSHWSPLVSLSVMNPHWSPLVSESESPLVSWVPSSLSVSHEFRLVSWVTSCLWSHESPLVSLILIRGSWESERPMGSNETPVVSMILMSLHWSH